MTIWKLTAADVEAVVSLVRAGHKLEEVAADLGISVEMAVCALRKWPEISRPARWVFMG